MFKNVYETFSVIKSDLSQTSKINNNEIVNLVLLDNFFVCFKRDSSKITVMTITFGDKDNLIASISKFSLS